MPIARSAFSRASAWKGNQPRETLRSHGGEEGWSPSDDERASPSKANPFRPRKANCRSINLPKVLKSATVGASTCRRPHWIDRGGWGERALKEQRNVPGDPSGQGQLFDKTERYLNCFRETITCCRSMRKSDRSIVVEKQGNACGAKGPTFSRVLIKTRRSA